MNRTSCIQRMIPVAGAASALLASSLTTGSADAAVLLAGWDDWAATSATAYLPDQTQAGFTATITQGNNRTDRVNASFGSTDDTFGTAPGASTANTPALLVRNQNNEGQLTITLTNNTGVAYLIESIHFDFAARQQDAGSTGYNAFTLTYVSGGLGAAGTQIDSQSSLPYVIFGTTNSSSDYPDYDYALAPALSDITLGSGESATFTLVFSGGNTGNVNVSSVVDNVAVFGSVVPEPATLSLIGLGAWVALGRRRGATV